MLEDTENCIDRKAKQQDSSFCVHMWPRAHLLYVSRESLFEGLCLFGGVEEGVCICISIAT